MCCCCGLGRSEDLLCWINVSTQQSACSARRIQFCRPFWQVQKKRAVHIASDVLFACDHTKLVKSFCLYPTSAKNLTEEDIINYKCDSGTRSMLLEAIHRPQQFRHIVQISSNCYAMFHGASQGPSNPAGYCHVIKDSDGQWYCSQTSCGRKSGNSKQLKVHHICAHLHVLFCILRLSSTPPDTKSISNASLMVNSTPDIEQLSLGVSRSSTIALNSPWARTQIWRFWYHFERLHALLIFVKRHVYRYKKTLMDVHVL